MNSKIEPTLPPLLLLPLRILPRYVRRVLESPPHRRFIDKLEARITRVDAVTPPTPFKDERRVGNQGNIPFT